MPCKTGARPRAYFITFTAYGTWLHGDMRTWVDREQAEYGTERLAHDPLIHHVQKRSLKHPKVKLTPAMIKHVMAAVAEVCRYREWMLVSANVRTNHVLVLAMADADAEKLLGDFKRYATRRLRKEKLMPPDRPIWTDGGSTIYVWDQGSLDRIDRYIRYGQGEDMGGRY